MVTALFVIIGAYVASFLVFIVLRFLARAASKTKTTLDDKVIGACAKPIQFAFLLFGVWYAAIRILTVQDYVDFLPLEKAFALLAILLGAYTVARITKTVADWYAESLQKKDTKKVDRTLFRFLRRIFNGSIYAVALIIILDQLGIEIGPLIAGLGIAGLAVALALQDTLSNVFSAVYIAADRPLNIDDYVELSSGERGYVEDIGWRTTKIRTLSGNLIIIPNAHLTKEVITNYNMPADDMGFVFPIGVAYGSDLAQVEKVTIEVAKNVLAKTEGGKKDFEPFIRYNEFGDSSINFSVILRVNTFVDQYLVKHEFIKALHARYKKEGIEIPFPQRDVHMRDKE